MEWTERNRIREFLQRDRVWGAYALADLEPGLWEHTRWFGAGEEREALALVFLGFAMPVVVALGDGEEAERALEEALGVGRRPPAATYFVVKAGQLGWVRERCGRLSVMPTQRMTVEEEGFRAAGTDGVSRLTVRDVPAIEALYRTDEEPPFFSASMVEQGCYFGIWEGGELAAVAGTHVLVEAEGVADIGNVHTRVDRRGRGLGSRVTSAVAAELLGRGLRTIVLNVRKENRAAIRVYERLGFREACDYYEVVGGWEGDECSAAG